MMRHVMRLVPLHAGSNVDMRRKCLHSLACYYVLPTPVSFVGLCHTLTHPPLAPTRRYGKMGASFYTRAQTVTAVWPEPDAASGKMTSMPVLK